jgi:N-acetylmuramoyl-L-alanine amidase
MLTSLLHEARNHALLWQRGLHYRWLARDKDGVAFALMGALLILGVAGIAGFAYLDPPRIESTRVQAAQREAARERRRASDLQCLAENVYFEARGEPLAGQYAVAEVTLNRTRAEHFPHTVCEVVHESRWDPVRRRAVADFSWTEFGLETPEDGPAWQQALAVANATYDDLHEPLVPGALFYHATSVRPEWSRTRRVITTIGNHTFYH